MHQIWLRVPVVNTASVLSLPNFQSTSELRKEKNPSLLAVMNLFLISIYLVKPICERSSDASSFREVELEHITIFYMTGSPKKLLSFKCWKPSGSH